MKKILKWMALVVLVGGMIWITRPASAGPIAPSDGGGTPNDTTSVDTTGLFAGWGKQVLNFHRIYSNLSFRLRVLTRDTNDSLRFYIQSTNHPDDTTSWVTFDSLGGKHVATGYTERTFLWNSASDTLRFIGTNVRVMVNHGFNASSSLATDTSRFYLDVNQWGWGVQ